MKLSKICVLLLVYVTNFTERKYKNITDISHWSCSDIVWEVRHTSETSATDVWNYNFQHCSFFLTSLTR